ncbi:MAG: thioredoxin domain-containing protein [Patescibacteria group bacterium]
MQSIKFSKQTLFLILSTLILVVIILGLTGLYLFTRQKSSITAPTQNEFKKVYDKEFGDMTNYYSGKFFYETHSKKNVELKGLDRVNIYFFTATDCVLCSELETNIENEKNNVKTDTTIFKVDMEKNLVVKNQYNVAKPGTLVLIQFADKAELKRIEPDNPLYPKSLQEILNFSKY